MNKNVKCIPFPEVENAYIVISGSKSENGNGCKKHMSFFYAGKFAGLEWEPDYGPITIIHPCEKTHPHAKKHFYFPYYAGNSDWSQLAVTKQNLPELFLSGDYAGIFNVLKQWGE